MSYRYLKLDDTIYRYVLDHTLREIPEQAALRAATRPLPDGGPPCCPGGE